MLCTNQAISSSAPTGDGYYFILLRDPKHVTAVVLSPLYVRRKNEARNSYYETRLSSGFVLPMVLAGLIVAIRTSSSSVHRGSGAGPSLIPSPDPSWVLRIGGSSWGLAGILVMLIMVLSWQESVQEFFWR